MKLIPTQILWYSRMLQLACSDGIWVKRMFFRVKHKCLSINMHINAKDMQYGILYTHK